MSLELAIKLAKTNPIKSKGRTSISRMSDVLTDGYRVIIGLNSYRTHPLQAKFAKKVGEPEKLHLHAEIAALAREPGLVLGSGGYSSYKMFIARVLKDGTVANAKPCNICMSALSAFGVKHIKWTE